MARVIGIVPAKGTSDGLPGKNMRLLAGRPLLVWTLEVARQACDLVIVSSEDPAILKVAAAFQRTIGLERSTLLAQARTPDYPVVHDAYTRGAGRPAADDVLVLLRPTAPFRTVAEIREVVGLLNPMACDSVRSVVRAREHPAKSYREAGYTQLPHNGARFPILEPWARDWHRPNHPRQLLPQAWRACGFIDAVRGDVVLGGALEGDVILGWPAPETRAFDIDDADDLARAEVVALQQGWTPGRLL